MRTGSSPSYLVRNPYSYCFRMKIPQDLQTAICKKELRYTLKTGSLSAAKNKARYLAGQFQLLFKKIRLMNLTKEQIHKLLIEYKKQLFEQYDKPTIYDPEHPISRETEFQWTDGYREWLLDLQASGNFWKKPMDGLSSIAQKADGLLSEKGTTEPTNASPEYRELCQGIVQAEVQGVGYYQQKLNGMPITTSLNSSTEQIASDPKQLITVEELIPQYMTEGKQDNRWSGKTPNEIESALKAFAELIGKETPCLLNKQRYDAGL